MITHVIAQPSATRASGRWPAVVVASVGLAILLLPTPPARAGDDRTILQWFETRFENVEHRVPDFFLAGYDAVWLPPVSRGADPNETAGFDVFDRFDLGRPGFETAYGTEAGFDAVVGALDDARHHASASEDPSGQNSDEAVGVGAVNTNATCCKNSTNEVTRFITSLLALRGRF